MQLVKTEQINSCMQMVIDYDDPLKKQNDILNAYKCSLGEKVSIIKYKKTKTVFLYRNNEENHYFLTSAVTYLGNPHPYFKKRIQLKKWYKDFYLEYKNKHNVFVHLIGIYHYDNMNIFCIFNLNDYICKKMHSSSAHIYSNDLYQAKGVEWPGWFLEYNIDKFINDDNWSSVMLYVGNKNKSGALLDFDLYFNALKFYGDLKASDITKKETIGNDQQNTLEAICRYGRLWYIIYEHETIKDSSKNNVMAKKRMQLIDPNYKIGDHIAYKSRMKYSVKFKRMRIFELNPINMHSVLSSFKQGHNSGKKRAERKAKFLLNKDQMQNSLIYTYEVG